MDSGAEKTLTENTNAVTVKLDIFEKSSFERLKKMIYEKFGLNCNGYREEYVRRRFEIRLKETKTLRYGSYISYLNKHPEEYDLLLNTLAVNYTTFFRDSDVYSFLGKNILPTLLIQPSVKIWSAGCSSGQEPYSLAILALKILEHSQRDCKVTIYASDVDREALADAASGLYSVNHLEGMEKWIITKYFTEEGALLRVKDFVKALVKFSIHDLMKPYTFQNLDLVLCRNVMIYFSREAQQKIHMNIFDALRYGGFFVAGKTEMLSGEPAQKFRLSNVQCRVYQKP